MKKIFSPALISLCISMGACSNLDQQPLDAIGPNTFFKTENDLKLYTNSFYDMLPSAEGVYNESVDNIIKNSFSAELQGNRQIPTSGGGWDWGQLRNINFYLDRSANCQDTAARDRYDAVARFFRAYFYFLKVKRFGDVPWYEHEILETDDDALMRARDPRATVMDNIIADLDFAIANLPTARSVGEISKWTALALKSRVCLWEGTFRKYHTEFNLPGADELLDLSIAASTELMDDSGYVIFSTGNPSTDYRDLFASMSPQTDEIILARSFSDDLAIRHNVNYYTIAASYGRPGLEKRFVDSYLMADGSRFTDKPDFKTMTYLEETRNRDLRLSQTIRIPGYTRIGGSETLTPEFGGTVTGYQLVKFVTSAVYDTYNGAFNPMPIFRYGEVLLNYCEAKAERGTLTQDDIDRSIKLLRDRVGMPNLDIVAANSNPDPYLAALYPSVSDENMGVLLEIRRERGVELVMENFRYDDILRWKNASIFADTFKGMYIPGPDTYDLDGDGETDICVWEGDVRPDHGQNITYLKIGDNIVLEHGSSGNITVNAQIVKKWDENRDYLYPIPINQRLINPNLAQNRGWNDGL